MVTKVSEITTKDIADYIRLDEVSSTEEIQLSTFLTVAKDYIKIYTALEDLDEYADLVTSACPVFPNIMICPLPSAL